MITLNPNATLSAITLLNSALVGANARENGTSVATFKGKLMCVLTVPPVIGSAPVNVQVNIFAHTNNHAAGGTSVVGFTLATNAATGSIQRVALDTRTLGANVFLSAQSNVAGTNANAYPTLLVFGANSANG
jgi:hypothetical protein